MKSCLLLLRALLLACCIFPLAGFAAPYSNQSSLGTKAFFKNAEDDEILPPDQAFKLSVAAEGAQLLHADFVIAPGHYLYRDRIKFELKTAGNAIAAVELPPGEAKQDPTFGQTQVFHNELTALIRLAKAAAPADKVTVLATYQGCSEKGLCYPPIHKTLEVDFPAIGPGNALGTTAASSVADASADSQAAALIKGNNLWLITASFFGFGLLLSLTPCVLPMIPILSGIIIGSKRSGHNPSRLHSFNLSLAYTLGMALSYTLAGIAAGLSGRLLSNALQNAWVLGTVALLFILLALSMFGWYELKLPSGVESRLVNAANRIKGGRFLAVLVMGAMSALIMSPCVAAPLAGALLYISQTHDIVLGGTALFALSLGMGVPLLLLGASAGALLPKAGPWMTRVRNFFGVVMLGMAIWLVSPLIPVSLQLGLWAALLIIPAIYMHALDSLPANANNWAKFWKGIAVILLLLGAAQLIGAFSGAKSPLQPLAGLRTSSAPVHQAALPFQRIKNLAELEARIDTAAGKIVMLDFYADWCVACKEFEQFTFSDQRVQQALKDVVLLQADVTLNSADDAALLKRFALFGPPGIIFFDRSGQQIPDLKVVGYQDADRFLLTLKQLGL
ncbi:MAG TPA: protein-disulfide reductase DsbD [Methylophilaceae bacterium]|nr:protein-disulfide reductase DsbD [Methylophilaceae bacterium]